MSHSATADKRLNSYVGVLLGTAVGDLLGLPAEGMSRQRIRARWGGVWRHRFLFGHGMVSDDSSAAPLGSATVGYYTTRNSGFQKPYSGA